METSFYTLWFRLWQTDKYLIWVQSENDSVYLTDNLYTPVFNNEKSLKKYAQSQNLKIDDESPILHNLDLAKHWLTRPHPNFDCLEFLAAWNLFTDVARSVRRGFSGNKKDPLTDKVYDKLFVGNNHPATTLPDNETYEPEWTTSEIKKLAEVMTEGLQLLGNAMVEIEN